ncbi:MAG: hypothetical protein JW785_03985 [Acidimicrobiia bacterium]|nr:hypothetical protein [Acidimicrobiia bacterium]
MTPVPRGPLRTVGLFAALVVVLALPATAMGDEPPECRGVPATVPGLTGTNGDDVIVGTSGPDVIRGLGGDDLICAGGGDDVVFAGRGNDEVHGGDGDDLLFGQRGRDSLHGDAGSDQIDGHIGQDRLDGGVGRDVLYGGDARDRLYGGEGNDVLYAGPDPDFLYGEGGDDLLFGEEGIDRLFGGDGDDELQGGSEDDRLFGDGGRDFLWGDDGDDTLIGGAGDDLLQGGPGVDNLQGRGGFDELWGGECGDLAGAVHCRLVPSGRPEGDPEADPGDVFNGGPAIDACNTDENRPMASLPGCEEYRGEHGLPSVKATSQEWWDEIVLAFEERAVLLIAEDNVPLADALMREVEHAKQIASCESLGDIFEMNPFGGATADGLFQHRSTYWAERAVDAGYPEASVFDPLANARVAAWLVAGSIEIYSDDPDIERPAWVHWSCDEYLIDNYDPPVWEPYP